MRRNSSSSAVGASSKRVRRSRAIPHLKHAPGLSETTSGCMGQKYSLLLAEISSGSRAIPHLGHEPGLPDTTSGSIGQKYFLSPSTPLETGGDLAEEAPNWTSPIDFGLAARYCWGLLSNFWAQWLQQKKYCFPACSRVA